MAKKNQPDVVVSFKLGDEVRIKNYAGNVGKFVERVQGFPRMLLQCVSKGSCP